MRNGHQVPFCSPQWTRVQAWKKPLPQVPLAHLLTLVSPSWFWFFQSIRLTNWKWTAGSLRRGCGDCQPRAWNVVDGGMVTVQNPPVPKLQNYRSLQLFEITFHITYICFLHVSVSLFMIKSFCCFQELYFKCILVHLAKKFIEIYKCEKEIWYHEHGIFTIAEGKQELWEYI